MKILTSTVEHYLYWWYEHDQYRDTEIWLYRHITYKLFGVSIWTKRERKVYLPVWSWASSQFGVAIGRRWFSSMGGVEVKYNFETGEVTKCFY